LPGFKFPGMIKEFLDYVKVNPKANFVEKALNRGGIRLVDESEIVYDKSDKFYQRFMENPFLVDDRFMDFTVYVLITSINPLRIYRYAEDVHLRFCLEPYYPFDPKNLEKYVVGDKSLDFLELPSMKEYYETYGFSFKNSIEYYMQKKGHNVTELWRKIDETIAQLVINNEQNIKDMTLQTFNSTHHFFDILRIDFLLNETLDPHLTEVSISPTITPESEKAEKYVSTYEQIVYDIIQIIGAGSKLDLMKSIYDLGSQEMLSNSKNIAVNPSVCVGNNCSENCDKPECSLCIPCLSAENIFNLHRAFKEKAHQGGFKRIFPTKVHFEDEDLIKNLSPSNQIAVEWFKEKCRENIEWC